MPPLTFAPEYRGAHDKAAERPRRRGALSIADRTADGDGLTVGHGRHGRGVFATRRFAVGDVVENCPTVQVPDADVRGRLRDYVFASVEDGDVVLALGYGMLYNHSPQPNVEYVQDEPSTITFLALRPIRAGDELTIDYGGEWWETRDQEPD